MLEGLTFAALLVGAVLLDGLVRPRPGPVFRLSGRSMAGLWLASWLMIALFGLFLALCGNFPLSAGLALALLALLVLASNAKHAMLGEPLLFSDLALIGAIFRHPQFYLSAISVGQRTAAGVVTIILVAMLAWLFVPEWQAHLAGMLVLLGSLAILAATMRSAPFRDIAATPDAHADVRRHDFLPTLLLYWLRWRESADPPPCPDIDRHPASALLATPELLLVVQCESFADPADLFDGPDIRLPGLSGAREKAWQWGQLEVSGFGAYTMRTEYGVLFGRSEDALGFRRYDPFLTALGEASYALPARLKAAGWQSLFVHPHDMRFYGRDRIMPAGGFADLVGEEHFAPVAAGSGRYVTDAALAEKIASLAREAVEPSLIYTVTIENHGPWAPDMPSGGDLVQSYLRLVRNSDAMLTTLLDQLAVLQRPALLVFFGDHRPSIPGATAPGGERHTPYVMMRLDGSGAIVRGDNRRVDLTPAGLHHAMLDIVLGTPAATLRADTAIHPAEQAPAAAFPATVAAASGQTSGAG
ncbi:LTA synthase family protein [Sphingobium sp. Sx8-8]|uniref:LTA synthase family protein n=1 Tax=Sphingobium sp. Sx8-8 TaxID=2933617 RepID=UPI001F5906BD|nr:LTA synthase family protein [Sphingobium sp. Sx8-8]